MTNILVWVEALFLLGVPVTALSWIVFRWVYRRGDLDRDADNKVVTARLKEIRKSIKTDKTADHHIVYRRWMRFGSGFYGLAGLWTFFAIETAQLLHFLFHPVSTLSGFPEDPPGYLIDVALNQVGNFISAFVWFIYWSEDGGNFLVTVAMAWAGYWLGIKLAQRDFAAIHVDRVEQTLLANYERIKQAVARHR